MNDAHAYVQKLVDHFYNNAPPKGWVYRGVDHFVLTHGREWGPRIAVPDGAPSTDKECFNNAASMVLDGRYKGLTYVEGYATAMLPLHHAWVVDVDGQVIDPTWDDHPDAEYFGVAFDVEYVRREVLRTETWGVLWEHDARPNLPLMGDQAEGWEARW